MEQTLRELGIPTDATPEEAAQGAAEEASQEEGEGDEQIEAQDQERLEQQQSGLVLTDDLDGDDDEGESTPLPTAERPARMDPALVPNPATPRGGRGGKKPERPQGVRMSKGIMDKVPGAEKVMVEKRIEGKKWFVAEFQREDLDSFANFQAFLTRYVKPKHGSGEYDLTGIDGRGNQHNLGQIRLLDDGTVKNSPDSNAIALVEKMMTENRERDERFMKQQMGSQQDPLALLAGVMNLKKQLDGEANAAGGGMADVFKSVMDSNKESGNTTMMMMMAMMQQQSQMMTAMMTQKKEPDPMMMLIMTKLLDNGGGGGGGGSAMPPPMPPPGKTEGLAEILTAMAAFMGSMSGGGGGDEDYKEIVKTIVAKNIQGDSNTLKDTIDLVLKLTQGNAAANGGGNAFKDAIDNMAAIMNVAQNINRQNEPGAAAGFFDALAALFGNRDFAGSIAQSIRAKMDSRAGSEQSRLQAEEQRLRMEAGLLKQERARAGLPSNTQQQTAPQRQQPVQRTAPNGAATGNTAPQPQTPFKPLVTSEEAQRAAQATVQRTGKIPELPANTYEHINNILTATDDGERVGKTIGMLVYFSEFDDWKQFSETLILLVRDGNRPEALKYLVALFEGLAAVGMYPPQAVAPLMEILNEHFTVVQEHLLDFATAQDQAPPTGEQLSQPPDGAVEETAA